MNAVVTALNVYPVKGCRGIAVERVLLQEAGLEHDRQWLVVTPEGRSLTQREHPALARVVTRLAGGRLTLAFPGEPPLLVAHAAVSHRLDVTIWGDRCAGLDCGDEAAERFSALLDRLVRLVEFDARVPRLQRSAWLGGGVVPVRFPDGYPILLVGEESLADLNARLPAPVSMDRFRPNLVVRGLGAYGEDRVRELRLGNLRLRPVKACTRCRVTMTDQQTGAVDAEEPLRTLTAYRWDRELHGVTFGQNVVVADGDGEWLEVGQSFEVAWRE